MGARLLEDAPEGLRSAEDYREIIQACGRLQSLRDLSLPCPAAAFQHLSALTGLTALLLRMWDAPAPLNNLTSLSALKSLSIEAKDWAREDTARFESLSPLADLPRLTSLMLSGKSCRAGCWVCVSGSEMSVLSQLTALRVLRYPDVVEANFVGPDPLPVQLRVLTSATALETLQLAFSISFWTGLSGDSCKALHAAVGSLHNLKTVRLGVWGERDGGKSFVPLTAFTGAPSIQVLEYVCMYARRGNLAWKAPSCLGALTQLRDLCFKVTSRTNCVDLLAGLPSRRLTSLELGLQDMTGPLAQEICRFRDLEKLSIAYVGYISLGSLGPLSSLTGLTSLSIRGPLRASSLRAQAARLRAAILESARQLGVAADVCLTWNRSL